MPLVKAVFVPITVKGADEAKLKIGAVNVAAEKLAAANPTITPKIETARALMEARLLRAGITAELSKAGADAGGRGGLFGGLNVGSGATGFLGGIQQGLNAILGLGPAALPVLGAIAVGIAIIVQDIGGAIAALAAAGLGFAAFGALAIPTVSKILAGVTAVGAAATKVARDKAWDAIPKSLQPAVGAVLSLQSAFGALATKIQPLVLVAFNTALRAANNLLPVLLPFAQAAGRAIDGLAKGFEQFTRSAGFKSFIAQMQTIAGPALTVLGRGIGGIVISIGKLLQQMSNPQGVATLQILLKGVALAIGGIGLAFEGINKFTPAAVAGILSFASLAIGAFRRVADVALTVIGTIIRGFAIGFGWLPGGIGRALKEASAHLDEFKTSIDKTTTSAQASLQRWVTAVRNAPKIFKLQADITNLQDRLAAARTLIADPRLTATKRARVEANIDNLLQQIARARAALDALQGKTVQTYIQTIFSGGQAGHPTPPGGVSKAVPRAAGGYVSGLAIVGEMGREVVALPQGSYVYPHAASERILAGGGNTYHITVNVPPGANLAEAGRQMTSAIRAFEKSSGKSWRTP